MEIVSFEIAKKLKEKGFKRMVGSKYCKEKCPHFSGVTKLLFWKFIKCKR